MSAEWEGDKAWMEKVRRIEDLADFSDVFNEVINEVIVPEVREQFRTEGRGRWARLTPEYERRKRRLYGDRPILQATGALFRSLTVPGAAGQIREVEPTEAFYGTSLPHAKFHQHARMRRRRRRILEVTREFRKRIRDSVAKKLGEKLRRV